VHKKDGKINQQWDIVYADEMPAEPKKGELNKKFGLFVERDFYIVSQLASHRYLDLINNRNMVIKVPNGRNTQKWYFDQKSLTIKTRLNNQSWDIQSAGKTNNMQVWSTNSGWFQVFKYEKGQFINWTNSKVLDVFQAKDEEGQKVELHNNNDGSNQKWNVLYVDKADAIETKGLNEEFGFHINRPFYFRSRMPMKRVIESIGANNITLKRWRKNVTAQQWWFDEKSKTIHSQQWKNYAMEIQSNGGSSNLRCTSGITSRWW